MTRSLLLACCLLLASCNTTPQAEAPAPLLPVPSEAQLAWQKMEMNMFVHFNMNTFTNMEWGFGNEQPAQFTPTALDCRQWARIAMLSGMKGIILTAKHHDGFCLWPSAYTEHSVKNSPWKDGKGDVVRELREACDEFGLKFGLYLSPWDRNHPEYGQPAYIEYYRNQLTELLTNYGEVFELWVDGANGGDGYYGGANETRVVDRSVYYDWDSTFALVRRLQPNTVIFSDAGPGCRWVGNEEGWANATNWSTLNLEGLYPGTPDYKQLASGHKGGAAWVPAEVNTSIRPGWYYHPAEDTAVKSLEKLRAIYDNSLGRNGLLLLNIPVDPRGLVHPNDSARLMELAYAIDADFTGDLAPECTVSASNERGAEFAAANVTNWRENTYWAVADTARNPVLTLTLPEPKALRLLVLEEFIELGQRVAAFEVEVSRSGQWTPVASETTIGYRRMLRLSTEPVEAIRIRFTETLAPVAMRRVAVY